MAEEGRDRQEGLARGGRQSADRYHDAAARRDRGLFAPAELLITEEENDRSALTYVVPSSLMVVEPNEPLRAAALELDAKLAALASTVTAV